MGCDDGLANNSRYQRRFCNTYRPQEFQSRLTAVIGSDAVLSGKGFKSIEINRPLNITVLFLNVFPTSTAQSHALATILLLPTCGHW